MPTVAVPSLSGFSHSCDLAYLRSGGTLLIEKEAGACLPAPQRRGLQAITSRNPSRASTLLQDHPFFSGKSAGQIRRQPGYLWKRDALVAYVRRERDEGVASPGRSLHHRVMIGMHYRG
jgi:hypothetical protein